MPNTCPVPSTRHVSDTSPDTGRDTRPNTRLKTVQPSVSAMTCTQHGMTDIIYKPQYQGSTQLPPKQMCAKSHALSPTHFPPKQQNSHNSLNTAQIELKIAEMNTTISQSPKCQKHQKPTSPAKTKTNSLPPSKPQKLFIPTPKCQNPQVQKDPRRNLTMTTAELHQHCEWVQSQTIHNKGHIQEASLVQPKTPHTAYATAGYIPKAIPDLITYLHVAAEYPVKQTWIKAIQQGHYVSWPGLTADRVHKYLTPKIETALGHMHKIKQGTKSTTVHDNTPKRQSCAHDLRIQTIRTNVIEDSISPERLKGLLATDLHGRYPTTSARGHKYLFVMYDYDANYIHATPIKSRKSEELIRGFRDSYDALTKHGI